MNTSIALDSRRNASPPIESAVDPYVLIDGRSVDDEEPIGWIGMVCVQCSIVCANRHYISNGVLDDDDDTYSLPNAAAATFAGLTSSSIPAI